MAMVKEKSSDVRIPLSSLWWAAVAFLFLWLFLSVIFGTWSWGLMDDPGLVSMKGSLLERFFAHCEGFYGQGRILWSTALHRTIFYTIFFAHPKAFYIFSLCELAVALGIWGWVAFRVTGIKSAFPLMIVIALAYRNLYDGTFYLSAMEILGLILGGLAVACFLKAFDQNSFRKLFLLTGIALLFLTFLAKEAYIGLGMALGAAFLLSQMKQKAVFWTGIGLCAFSAMYAIFLKFFMAKGYTADYIVDVVRITVNFATWAKDNAVYHLSWMAVIVGIFFYSGRGTISILEKWGLWLGVLSYAGFLLLLLPWTTNGYYSVPLGVFFAFAATIFLAPRLEALPKYLWTIVFLIGVFSAYTGAEQALRFHSGYQRDTQALVQWMAQNALFEHDISQGAVVRGNADEPCGTLFQQVRMTYGKSFPSALFTPSVRDIMADPQTRYYIYGMHWGDQDLRRLQGMWTPMFTSENWIVFRRMY